MSWDLQIVQFEKVLAYLYYLYLYLLDFNMHKKHDIFIMKIMHLLECECILLKTIHSPFSPITMEAHLISAFTG